MKKILLCALMAMVIAVSAASHCQAQWFLFKNPLLGKQAKEFSLKDLSGNLQSLSALRDNRPAVLFFWATWCPHCVNQLAGLKQHNDDFRKKGIQLILIDLGEDAETVQNFLTRKGVPFDVLIDATGDIASDYGVQGVPTYVFINKEGIVQAVEHVLPENYERLLQ